VEANYETPVCGSRMGRYLAPFALSLWGN